MAKKKAKSRKRAESQELRHPPFPVEQVIHTVRGHKVILDADLATLYRVETRTLNQAVKRNADRFPADFMFQLTTEESEPLRSQSVISKVGRGGRRYLPNAFTEHGALMAANVLNSQRAIEASVFVVRAFVKMRGILAAHKDLARRLNELEKKYDQQFNVVFATIRELMEPPEEPPKGQIGFRVKRK